MTRPLAALALTTAASAAAALLVQTPVAGASQSVASSSCTGIAIASDTDVGSLDVRTTAGRQALLAYRAPSETATVTVTRTSPEPVAVVRQGPAQAFRYEVAVAPTVNTTLSADSDADAPDCAPVVRRVLVAPQVTLAARRNAPRDYSFSGRVFPARGQRVSLSTTPDPNPRGEAPRLIAQGTVSPDGTYLIHRKFVGSGRFVVYAHVSAVSTNIAGAAAGRTTVIH